MIFFINIVLLYKSLTNDTRSSVRAIRKVFVVRGLGKYRWVSRSRYNGTTHTNDVSLYPQCLKHSSNNSSSHSHSHVVHNPTPHLRVVRVEEGTLKNLALSRNFPLILGRQASFTIFNETYLEIKMYLSEK